MNFLTKLKEYNSLKAQLKFLEKRNNELENLRDLFKVQKDERFIIRKDVIDRGPLYGSKVIMQDDLPESFLDELTEKISSMVDDKIRLNQGQIENLKEKIKELEES